MRVGSSKSLFSLLFLVFLLSSQVLEVYSWKWYHSGNNNGNSGDDDDDDDDTGGDGSDPSGDDVNDGETSPSGTTFVMSDIATQKFQCGGSTTKLCTFQFTPSTSSHRTVEITVYFESEDPSSATLSKYAPHQILFCNSSTSECDYTGQYLSLRNLSVTSNFSSSSKSNLMITINSTVNVKMYMIMNILPEKTCVNSNCGGNGQCSILSNNLGECICYASRGGKNCDAVVSTIDQNTEHILSIPPQSQSTASFAFSSNLSTLLKNKQLNLILQGNANPNCNIQIINEQSQYKDGTSFVFTNGDININNIFSTATSSSSRFLASTSTTGDFNLLLIANNNSVGSQQIIITLKVTDSDSSSSEGERFFLFFLIGLFIIVILILILSCIYFIKRRRLLQRQQLDSRAISNLQQALIPDPSLYTKIPRENFQQYFKLLNKAIPTQQMTPQKLEIIINEAPQSSEVSLEEDSQKCTCSICLSHIELNQSFRKTICSHYFHLDCFDAWIKKQKNCPMCRTSHEISELEKYIQNGKKLLSNETHQIKGKSIEFEMFENPISNKPNITNAETQNMQTRIHCSQIQQNVNLSNIVRPPFILSSIVSSSANDLSINSANQTSLESSILQRPSQIKKENLSQKNDANTITSKNGLEQSIILSKKRINMRRSINRMSIIKEEDEKNQENLKRIQSHYNFSLQQGAQAQYLKSRFRQIDDSFIFH